MKLLKDVATQLFSFIRETTWNFETAAGEIIFIEQTSL